MYRCDMPVECPFLYCSCDAMSVGSQVRLTTPLLLNTSSDGHLFLPPSIMQSVFHVGVICVMLCWNPAATALKHGSSARTKSDAAESAADFLLSAKMQAQQLDDLTAEVGSLAADVSAGGDRARCAICLRVGLSCTL